ncbi:MAG: RIP metalloprotease RseP [Pseudomonadota bacterium]
MDFLTSIPLIGPLLGWILPFIIVLSIVVAIHELGHLMVGRWCGIKAEVYSIGFGRVIWSRKDRHGTIWQVAILPLGGFVKFLGDMDPASAGKADESEIAEEDRPRAFHNAALWKRTLTVLAGPVANFLLSILIIFFLSLSIGKHSQDPVIGDLGDLAAEETPFLVGDRVLSIDGEGIETFADMVNALILSNGESVEITVDRDGQETKFTTEYKLPPRIIDVRFDGAAIKAGLQPGDIVQTIDGQSMVTSRQLQLYLANMPHDQEVTLEILRSGNPKVFAFTPDVVHREHPETGEMEDIPTLGVSLDFMHGLSPALVSMAPLEAAERSVNQVWTIIERTVLFIHAIFVHEADTSSLSGPIGIAKHSANAADRGVQDFIMFIAFVSTAIGLFNLFPIPVLDGGHLCFYLFEAIRGKPNNDVVVRYSTMAGLSLLLLLMVFVTINNDLGLGDWFAQN